MQIAVSGKEFCKAAEKATKLVVNNKSRVGDVIVIGDLILFLGKLCVSFACALFAFLMLDTHRYKTTQGRVSSPLFPVLVSLSFPNLNCCQKDHV
jgi:choline transporter-like protein 2/4/5